MIFAQIATKNAPLSRTQIGFGDPSLRKPNGEKQTVFALIRHPQSPIPGRNSLGMNCSTTLLIPIFGVNVNMMTPLVVAVRIKHSP